MLGILSRRLLRSTLEGTTAYNFYLAQNIQKLKQLMITKEMVKTQLWEKRALIKIVFVSILCFFVQESKAQNISGKYRFVENKNSRTYSSDINFKENGEFTFYQTTGHTKENVKGSGHYKFEGKEMTLNFDLTTSNREGKTKVESKESQGDSITIDFEIYDLWGKTRCCGHVIYNLDGQKQSFKINKEGKGRLIVPKQEKEVDFTYNSFSYGKQGAVLTLNKDYVLKLYIVYVDYQTYEDVIWKYQVKKANKKTLVLMPKDSKKQKWRKVDK